VIATGLNLELQLATLSDDELQDVAGDRAEQYTAEARSTALRLLERRASADPASALETAELRRRRAEGDARIYAVEETIERWTGRVFAPFLAVRDLLTRLTDAVVPPGVPVRIRDLFWVSLLTTLPGIRVLVRAWWDVRVLTSTGGIVALTIGAGALLLAYGILTERRYTRPFAIVFAAVIGIWSIFGHRRPKGDSSVEEASSGALPWAFETARYMWWSSEAATYYAQLRAPAVLSPAPTDTVQLSA
jgi:hypothetical protein